MHLYLSRALTKGWQNKWKNIISQNDVKWMKCVKCFFFFSKIVHMTVLLYVIFEK